MSTGKPPKFKIDNVTSASVSSDDGKLVLWCESVIPCYIGIDPKTAREQLARWIERTFGEEV